MRLSYNLKQKQSQKLIMTPELRQAIEILQFNSMELNKYISNELEVNPVLEIANETVEIEGNHKDHDEIDWKKYLEKDDTNYGIQIEKNQQEYNYENFIVNKTSLHEHLMNQLNVSKIDSKEYKIGENIISNIDKNGYLELSLKNIAEETNQSIADFEKVLSIIQKFDPLGVGARNLKECLLIQIREDFQIESYVIKIIENNLEDLGNNKIQKIAKEHNISLNDVEEALDYIRKLEPKPGSFFNQNISGIRYITPDAEIKIIDGKFKVILSHVAGPRLNINSYYRELMKKSKDEKAVEYLKDRFNRAIWVIRSVEQRRETIKKVIESILKFQMDFFLHGEKHLKALTLKEVAEDIEMHESTISRTTNGKYVQTPKGLFELKYFFSSGLSGKDGDMSSTSIKYLVKEIIDNEDSKKPYSDQKISKLLKEKEIEISRRTVAKYRSELNILSSSKRRRF